MDINEQSVEMKNLDLNKNDQNDDLIEEPFKISKNGLNILMNSYLSRKLDEELVVIKRKGGIKWFENALQTNFLNGINDTDDFINRKRVFDTNEKEEEEPLSIKISHNRFLQFCLGRSSR